ncbi:CsoS2 family carboxysome shell protein [Synechococcus sp. CCY9202]|uniref:carboxysome assembly protein CsoS2 n=1 Tax=Synechococcus sp. CCY9202 TaxID=174698 RepID=UPI002B1FAF11|nr:CsoS2 family carboxysome shell protein [Synechococcus sp. CCY9202]MEA5423326.1 CsoS2 family carboxysome shell protein [Synechococcus sp. CCY9202]
MASTSSRDAALERRKALTSAGKKAAGRYGSSASRVRTAADARPTRTSVPEPVMAPAAPVQATRPGRPARSAAMSLSAPAPSRTVAAPTRSTPRPISNPSRELVLSRREALSKRGKRADTSRDRTRTDLQKVAPAGAGSSAASAGEHKCKCQERQAEASAPTSSAPARRSASLGSSSLGSSLSSRSSSAADRRPAVKRASQHNPSRSLVLARREALSKRGKAANTPSNSTAAAVARQGNPDLTTRELAQKVRELKSKVGSSGATRGSGSTRPTGPNLHGAKQAAAADAHWKVGVSETLRGQTVTGTQANRSPKTTGNEASTCRTITGTEYMGAEVFQSFCQDRPSPVQPAKVRVTATSHGNRVTGNEVGRSEKVTGDEPGTCKTITGTEYISANQALAYCGDLEPSPRKVGHSQTLGGRPVSGVMVGRSERVTGDEPGSGRQLTGTQYLGSEPLVPGRAPDKVNVLQTLRGTGITGTHVGRSERVTGDEPGSCRRVTGDEYIGRQQYEGFCGSQPEPEAAKVGFSITNKAQVVSGTRTGRSSRVTGDEPGTCKAVTGTPYAGLEQAGDWCSSKQVKEIRQRTPARLGTPGPSMTGLQPGIGGVMTGAERGACEPVTGTPYLGADQMAAACSAAETHDADFPQPLDSQPWEQFSIQSPARAAQSERQKSGAVTGTSYEQGNRITGPFDMASGKVTGTEQFRFDRHGSGSSAFDRISARGRAPISVDEDVRPASAPERPVSRVTGEGISAGLKITGDDWDRGERVTGTEGASARQRNPSRPGPMTAMPTYEAKRNEAVPAPVSRVTGSSGNTDRGSLVTVSGGARG